MTHLAAVESETEKRAAMALVVLSPLSYITGAGSGTSDSIAARLSNGEYVVNAAATARNRALLDAVNYGPGTIVGRAPSPGAGAGGGSQDFTLTAPVEINLDNVGVWRGLLHLKRSRGGIELGLS